MRRRLLLLLLFSLPLFLTPRPALACPACKGAAEADPALAAGYSWSVLALAGMPFLLIAVLGSQAVRALSPETYDLARRRLWAFARRRGWVYALAGLLMLAAAGWLASPPAAAAGLRLPAAALDRRSDLRGLGAIRLADLESKAVAVTFFASWCEPCREQVAELAALQEVIGGERLAVVAVNAFEDFGLPHTHADGTIHYHRPSSPFPELAAFLQSFGPGMAFVSNTPELSAAFGDVTRIPTTFVFDARGRLVQRYVNDVTGDFYKPAPETLRRDVERALACGETAAVVRSACLKLWQ